MGSVIDEPSPEGEMGEMDEPVGSRPDESLRDRPEHGRVGEADRRTRLAEAAVEAEFLTGAHEETVAEAKAAIHVRLARMALGFLVVLVGIVLLPLPGPGWLVIAAGFVILSRDFAWAERTLAIVRRRLPADADGRIPPKTWFAIGTTTTLGVTASLWWTFWR